MRDRLIELLKGAENKVSEMLTRPLELEEWLGVYADYLLANGVIVPPMKLEQICFRSCDYLNKIDECRVSSIMQKADGTFKIRLTNLRGKWVFEITAEEIGKTVFLTREEAEAKLKGEQ